MIVVDTSVWVDYFGGTSTRESDHLDHLLGREPVAIGDIILTEVLQGFRDDPDFSQARRLFKGLTVFDMFGRENAVRSAEAYRSLRNRGITIRTTADVVIGSYCVRNGHSLLYSDRDFAHFEKWLGLRNALSIVP